MLWPLVTNEPLIKTRQMYSSRTDSFTIAYVEGTFKITCYILSANVQELDPEWSYSWLSPTDWSHRLQNRKTSGVTIALHKLKWLLQSINAAGSTWLLRDWGRHVPHGPGVWHWHGPVHRRHHPSLPTPETQTHHSETQNTSIYLVSWCINC